MVEVQRKILFDFFDSGAKCKLMKKELWTGLFLWQKN
jgi:hypothetical protein